MTLLRDAVRRELIGDNVQIVEFCESTDYCGKPLYPLQRVLLKFIFLEEMEGWEEDLLTFMINGGRGNEFLVSPDLRARRDWCRDQGYDHFTEIDLVGGRRSSKGHITGLAGAYKLWKTRQIPDPAAFFGMDIDRQIEFSCIAASFDQAKTRQFADFYSSINRCKALQPYIGKRQEESITILADTDIDLIKQFQREGVKVQKDFAKFKVLPLAANADTLRGSASILIVFDEMAFMMPGESRSSAQECYTAAEPSLAQFGHHAFVFCNSSPYTRIGQFYTQFEQAMQGPNHKDGWYQMRFAIQWPSWALYDKWWKDPGKKWSSAIMVSPDWEDQLEADEPDSKLNEKNLTMRETEKLKEKASPDTYRVEYRGQWAEVLDAYLRPEMVDRAFNGLLPNADFCKRTFGGTYRHMYLAHCDPASTTAGFGFAMGHVEEFPDETGIFPDGVARHVVFDLVKRWNPKDFAGGTINYLTVRQELAHLCNLYRPNTITFDQYNSRGLIDELREDLRKMSIQETRVGEVTATQKVNWNRWEAFKTALYLGLVHVPPDCFEVTPNGLFDHSEYAKQELKFLQEVVTGQTRRVDKQELGPIQTKDVADCIAEVTVKFLGSYVGDFLNAQYGGRVAFGAEGGYQVGGRQQGGAMGGMGLPSEKSSVRNRSSAFEFFYGRRSNADHSAARGIRPRRRGGF